MATGLRIRLKRVPGLTARGVLSSALVIPVATGEFTWTEDALYNEYDTHRAGQYAIPSQGPATARQLRDLGTLETFTLDWPAAYLMNPEVDHADFRSDIQAILRTRSPVELLATVRPSGDEELRMIATLRTIARTLRPGEADTRYWSIAVKEHRVADIERLAADAVNEGLPTRKKLDADDTWASLADHYYGAAVEWKLLATANGVSSWGARTPIVRMQRFKVGDYVKIPKQETLSSIARPNISSSAHRA